MNNTRSQPAESSQTNREDKMYSYRTRTQAGSDKGHKGDKSGEGGTASSRTVREGTEGRASAQGLNSG